MPSFNDRIKQLLVLALLLMLVFLTIKELFIFLPGLLGALTLYILSRGHYFQMVYNRKWKRGRAATFFIIYYLLLLGLPIFLSITLISPKINAFLDNPTAMLDSAKASIMKIQHNIGVDFVNEESLSNSLSKLTSYIPKILNSTATLVSNLAVMLFMLYYMLYHGRDIEKFLTRVIPLKTDNINLLASETKKMVRANALGIPLISIIQGLTAMLGYWICHVHEFALWGFLTGVFAFFPVVGTMIVWVPLDLYLFATGDTMWATILLVYSVVVTGNVDYLARMTLLRRLGDVHPVITILGVIVGLGLFGFIGLIFGPLLISYIVVLFEIYMNEFVRDGHEAKTDSAVVEDKPES